MTNAVNITVALSKVIVFTIFANTLYVNFVVDRGETKQKSLSNYFFCSLFNNFYLGHFNADISFHI